MHFRVILDSLLFLLKADSLYYKSIQFLFSLFVYTKLHVGARLNIKIEKGKMPKARALKFLQHGI